MIPNVTELTMPKFLRGSDNNEYTGLGWIYSPPYMSLIMVVDDKQATALLHQENSNMVRKTFKTNGRSFELIIVQNNVQTVGGHLAPKISEDAFLIEAFHFFLEL